LKDWQIFVGDYVRALGALRPDEEETARAIASLLGLNLERPGAPSEEAGSATVSVKVEDAGERNRRAETERGAEEPPPPGAFDEGEPLRSSLVALRSEPAAPPEWLATVGQWSADAVPAPEPDPPEPLFVRKWVRGILTVVLSTHSPDGPVDIEEVTEKLSNREPLFELPRLVLPTMRRGLQLLLDMGEGMRPFVHDQSSLQKEIADVVGREGLEVLRYAGSPLRGAGKGSRRSWKPYQPPACGTPVLLLSDLGIGRSPFGAAAEAAGVEEWREFAALLRRTGCPLLAFVPYPPSRWPSALGREMHMVQWDRATNVTTLRRLVGRVLEVKR